MTVIRAHEIFKRYRTLIFIGAFLLSACLQINLLAE